MTSESRIQQLLELFGQHVVRKHSNCNYQSQGRGWAGTVGLYSLSASCPAVPGARPGCGTLAAGHVVDHLALQHFLHEIRRARVCYTSCTSCSGLVPCWSSPSRGYFGTRVPVGNCCPITYSATDVACRPAPFAVCLRLPSSALPAESSEILQCIRHFRSEHCRVGCRHSAHCQAGGPDRWHSAHCRAACPAATQLIAKSCGSGRLPPVQSGPAGMACPE